MLEQLRDQFEAFPLDFYSHLFLLLPVAMAVYRRKLLTPALAVVAIYFGIRFLEETVFLYYALQVMHNIGLINRTLILDMLVIGLIYYLGFVSSRLYRRTTVIVTLIAFLIAVLNVVLSPSQARYTAVSWPIIRLLLIILSLAYFNKILAENRVRTIVQHSLFWVCAGFLFYGMGTFMTSVFNDYLIKSPKETYNVFSYMKELISMLCSIMVATGIWVSKYDKDNYIQPV